MQADPGGFTRVTLPPAGDPHPGERRARGERSPGAAGLPLPQAPEEGGEGGGDCVEHAGRPALQRDRVPHLPGARRRRGAGAHHAPGPAPPALPRRRGAPQGARGPARPGRVHTVLHQGTTGAAAADSYQM